MCECKFMDPDDVVLPTVQPLGGFTPLMCCLCGRHLRGRFTPFREGPVCGSCFFRLPVSVRRAFNEQVQEKGGGQ